MTLTGKVVSVEHVVEGGVRSRIKLDGAVDWIRAEFAVAGDLGLGQAVAIVITGIGRPEAEVQDDAR